MHYSDGKAYVAASGDEGEYSIAEVLGLSDSQQSHRFFELFDSHTPVFAIHFEPFFNLFQFFIYDLAYLTS